MEIDLPGDGKFARILTALGFEPVFRYEKFRTEYSDGHGAAMLDQTPIGDFLELEGAPEWIDEAAQRLGFATADYITASYGALYIKFRRENPGAPPDMLFRQPAAKPAW